MDGVFWLFGSFFDFDCENWLWFPSAREETNESQWMIWYSKSFIVRNSQPRFVL